MGEKAPLHPQAGTRPNNGGAGENSHRHPQAGTRTPSLASERGGTGGEVFLSFAGRWGFAADSVRLRAALTHRSAAASPAESNERLEFLGDALLSAFVARYLLDALPQETPEGALSRARVQVVRKETLAEAARAMGVPDLLEVGQGERKENRHTHDGLLADAYEALIAARFLDDGEEAMAAFLRETLAGPLAIVTATPPEADSKTRLQERLQAVGRGLPTYPIVEVSGSGHYHVFVAEARAVDGTLLGRGEGPSKRAAQTAAAQNALDHLSGATQETQDGTISVEP